MTEHGTGDGQHQGWVPATPPPPAHVPEAMPPVPPFLHGHPPQADAPQPGYGPYGQPPQSASPPPGYGPYGQQPPFYGYPAAYAPRSTNGLAIASMVLGILWLYWIGSILAIVFGYVALGQIKRQPGMQGRGMAIAGIVLGWVGVAMIVLGLLFFAAARNGG